LGITAKFKKEIELVGINAETFLAMAFEIATKLNWQISGITPNGITAYTAFSMYSWSEKISIVVENNIVFLKSECTGNQIIDFGKNRKNINILISQFEQIKNNLSEDEVYEKIAIFQEALLQKTTQEAGTQINESTNTKSVLSVFIPNKTYFITPILFYLNIIYFLIMVINGVAIWEPTGESLLPWGANFKAMTLGGEWWRMVTSCFIHIGVLHLIMNMYALIYIGLLLEPILGKSRFLSAYLLSGLLSSLASLWWHDNTVSAGASGAIFGMYGVFLALLTTDYVEQSARKVFLSSIVVFVGYNLLYGANGSVDNAAHIGGLVSGMALGYAYLPSLRNFTDTKLKNLIIGLVTIASLIVTGWVYSSLPNDVGAYLEKMKEFSDREKISLTIYTLDDNLPKDKVLKAIEDKGIFNWKRNLVITKELEALNLPIELKTRNETVKKYCELRLKLNELIYKKINEETPNYDYEINLIDKQLEKILTDFEKQE